MVALRIYEVASAKGLTIAHIQRETQIPPMTMRRLFYSSKTGLRRDMGTLVNVNLNHLEQVAEALDVPIRELFTIPEGANQ
jgi:hypothetical protein